MVWVFILCCLDILKNRLIFKLMLDSKRNVLYNDLYYVNNGGRAYADCGEYRYRLCTKNTGSGA